MVTATDTVTGFKYWLDGMGSGFDELFVGGFDVFDPFAGSGAVLRACQNRGRRCVGIELVGEYCELAKSLLIDPKEFL